MRGEGPAGFKVEMWLYTPFLQLEVYPTHALRPVRYVPMARGVNTGFERN
jgi:hypothetical protein